MEFSVSIDSCLENQVLYAVKRAKLYSIGYFQYQILVIFLQQPSRKVKLVVASKQTILTFLKLDHDADLCARVVAMVIYVPPLMRCIGS